MSRAAFVVQTRPEQPTGWLARLVAAWRAYQRRQAERRRLAEWLAMAGWPRGH